MTPGESRCVLIPSLKAIVTVGDDTIYTITANGRTWRFEFSQRFGPAAVGKRGEILETRQPKAFYEAVSLWAQQGHRVNGAECIYDVPMQPKLLKLRGRNYCEDTPYNRKHFAKWLDANDPGNAK